MRVWFDGQCFQSASRYRGIGRYVMELLRQLKEDNPDIVLVTSLNAAMYDEAIIARRILSPIVDPENIHVWEGIPTEGECTAGYDEDRQLSETLLAYHVGLLQPDIILSTSLFEGGHDASVPFTGAADLGIPQCVIFYDAIPRRYPEIYLLGKPSEDYYFRRLKLFQNFDHVLAISEFSRQEISEIYPGIPATNIAAGISHDFAEILSGLTKSPRSDDIIKLLYVGGLDWRKNIRAVIDALSIMPEHMRAKLQLDLVGDQPDFQVKEIMEYADRVGSVSDKLNFVGFRSDTGLCQAYLDSDIVLQPSFMEGFGLTALEAMSCGTPVLAANAGALPEVVGNPDNLFDPANPAELAACLTRMITDQPFRKACVASSLEQAKTFTWAKSAKKTCHVFESLSTEKNAANLDAAILADLPPIEKSAVSYVAGKLSALEPDELHDPALFIDVTSTFRANHGTGIQRVVGKVATEAMTRAVLPLSPELVICETHAGFEQVRLTKPETFGLKKSWRPKRYAPSHGDTILMLDSSWTFHKTHKTVLRAARLKGARVISVLYDLVPIKFPGFCDDGMPPIFAEWLGSALMYSDGFMCISKAVAEELKAFLKSVDFPRPMDIGYWTLGANFQPNASSGKGDPKHFLTVATLEPRKGHNRLLDAFEVLWAEGADYRLTLVGRPGWNTDALQDRIRSSQHFGEKLHWRDKASDADLAEEYLRAGTVIAPSYAEGFGLPIVEGALNNCHVIATDLPVFREVAPAGTQFFKTQKDLKAAIARAAREDFGAGEIDIEKLVSWDASAAQLFDRIFANEFPCRYEPETFNPWAASSDIGPDKMQVKIHLHESQVELSLLEGPQKSPRADCERYLVSLKNCSPHIFISEGINEGDFAIFLSYQSYDSSGAEIETHAVRTRLPFALGRDQSMILPVDVFKNLTEKGAETIRIRLVQEASAWWPDYLEINLG